MPLKNNLFLKGKLRSTVITANVESVATVVDAVDLCCQ